MSDLVIRWPRPLLIAMILAGLASVTFGLIMIVTGHYPWFFVVWILFAVVGGLLNAWPSVRAHGDTLSVRNYVRVREFSRSEIAHFVWTHPSRRESLRRTRGRSTSMGTFVTVVLTTGESMMLRPTTRWPKGGAEVERIRQALEDWRTAPGAFSRT